jgi:hypothetical protein
LTESTTNTDESRPAVGVPVQQPVGRPVPERCHANRDGDCTDARCPQLRDGEPATSGRHCPLDVDDSDDSWLDDDDDCEHCRGDGMDPDCDYLLPCPDCGGPQ